MDMVIISEKTGKKFVVKVNSATGEYLQPLESGPTLFDPVFQLRDLPKADEHRDTPDAEVQGVDVQFYGALAAGR